MKDVPIDSKSRRRFLITVGVAGGAAALSSSLPMRVWAKAPPAINIGQIAPMTGSAAEFGPFYKDAVQLAVQQINKAAEQVFGGPIIAKHYTEDTNTLPTPAVQGARKLVEADGAPAIIGGWSSGVTVAVATSVTIPAGVLQIANGATSPLISVLPEDAKTDLLFRTTSSDALQGVVAAQLAAGQLVKGYKYKTASTIFINNPYGQGLSNAFSRSFQERGGEVFAQVPHPEEVQPTYKSQLAVALKDKPELLVAVSYPAHTSVFLKESRDVFGFTTWQFVDGNKSQDVLKAIGAKDLDGKYGTAPGEDTNAPAYKAFAAAYKSGFKRDRIPPFTASAYDAGVVIGLALAKAIADGMNDASKITGKVLRDKLREVSNSPGKEVLGGSQHGITEALKLIKEGKKINYTGAAGPDDFDPNGDVITPIEIWKFSGGNIETVMLEAANKIPKV